MSDLSRELCGIIDKQDIHSLLAFLEQHPDLNLNAITPNGLSALWWALIPPVGQSPSRAIIQSLLETQRIDKGQSYETMPLHEYASPQSIQRLIQSYQWATPPYTEAPPHELAMIAADKQNTHDTRIVKAVDQSIISLYKQYVSLSVSDKLPWDSTLETWLALEAIQLKRPSTRRVLDNAMARIQKDDVKRLYQITPDHSVELTLAQVLMLLWRALNEPDPRFFVFGSDMTAAGIRERKIAFFNHMVSLELDVTSICWMGLRNHVVSGLDAIHRAVCIGKVTPLSAEIITQRYAVYSKEALLALAQYPILLTDYIQYYVVSDALRGNGSQGPLPDQLVDWVKTVKARFVEAIHDENTRYYLPNMDLTPSELRGYLTQINHWLDALLDPLHLIEGRADVIPEQSPLHHEMVPLLRQLDRYFILLECGLGQTIRSEWQTPAVMDAIKKNLEKCYQSDELLDISMQPFLAILVEATSLNAIDHWLSSHPDYRLFLEALPDKEHATWLKMHFALILDNLLQQTDSPCVTTEWLFLELKSRLASITPSLTSWLTTLSKAARLDFTRVALEKNWHNRYHDTNTVTEILKEAVVIALKRNEFTPLHLPLDQPITLIGHDLRGLNLKTCDLSTICLQGCDLRLTHIARNPTLQAQHILHNTLDPDWLSHLIMHRNWTALHAIMTDPDCTIELLSIKDTTLLHLIAYEPFYLLFKTILDAPYFSVDLLFKESRSTQATVLDSLFTQHQVNLIEILLVHPRCISIHELLKKRIQTLGMPLLHIASKNACLYIAKIILNSPQLTRTQLLERFGDRFVTILHEAVSNHDIELVKQIVASPHCSMQLLLAPDKMGYTPLDEAVLQDQPQLVNLFVKSPSFLSHSLLTKEKICGETLLHWAIRKNCLYLVQTILQKNTNEALFHIKSDTSQLTALQKAIQYNQLDVIKYLLMLPHFPASRLVDKGISGDTILHWAVEHRYLDIIDLVLQKCRSNHLMQLRSDWSGLTPLEMAMRDQNPDIVMLFLQHPHFEPHEQIAREWKTCDIVLHWAAQYGHLPVIEHLFNRFYSANLFDGPLLSSGEMALKLAITHQQMDVVKMLVNHLFFNETLLIKRYEGRSLFDLAKTSPSILKLCQHRYFLNPSRQIRQQYASQLNPVLGAKKLLTDFLKTDSTPLFFKVEHPHEAVNKILDAIDSSEINELSQLIAAIRAIPLFDPLDPLSEITVFLEQEREKEAARLTWPLDKHAGKKTHAVFPRLDNETFHTNQVFDTINAKTL